MKRHQLLVGLTVLMLLLLQNSTPHAQTPTPQEKCVQYGSTYGTFSPDGKYALISNWPPDGMTKFNLWSANTGKLVHTFSTGDSPISFATFSPDGKYILTGSGSGLTVMWDAHSGKKLKEFLAPAIDPNILYMYDVLNVELTPDGKHLFTADYTSGRLWDIETGEQIRAFPSTDIDFVDLSPDGNYVLIEKGSPELWDAHTAKLLHVFKDAAYGSFSPKGTYILTWEDGMKLWDTKTYKQIGSFYWPAPLWEFSPDEKYLVNYDTVQLRLFDVGTGITMQSWDSNHYQRVQMVFSPDSKYLLFTGDRPFPQFDYSRNLVIWDLDQNQEVKQLVIDDSLFLAISPDGKSILAGLQLWDIVSGKQLRRLC
jgi:hypothetical protein